MTFLMRTTKPKADNKYYIRKENGGYSNAIQGYPKDSECDVLANCVGYAYGRFNEIGGYGFCKYLAPVNAKDFMEFKGSCAVGQSPKTGACMVWRKGSSFDETDGAGHVAIVEKVISETEVLTSESGYGSQAFWNQIRQKGNDGLWGCDPSYSFLGFIYNPAVEEDEPVLPEKKQSPDPQDRIEIRVYDLRKRSDAGLDKKILGYAEKRIYPVLEHKSADGYDWCKIGEGEWVAYDPKWAALFSTVSSDPCICAEDRFAAGDVVNLLPDAVYYGGEPIPELIKERTWILREVIGDRAVIDKSEDGWFSINSPVNIKYLKKADITSEYLYRVVITTPELDIRKGAGAIYPCVGSVKSGCVCAIKEESKGPGADSWGKLAGTDGWIPLDFAKKL